MDKLYFSDRIRNRLSHLHGAGLTMIEAPAGYGKTTAVRWEMDKLPPQQVHWFTAVSFHQDASIDWLISQIGMMDAEAGEKLRGLGFLNRSNVTRAADILTGMHVTEPVYLIFDNFQLIRDNWPPLLLRAMADRRPDGLHIILISQNFGKLRVAFENSSAAERISAEHFQLSRSEIMEYGEQAGIELTEEAADVISRNTEGWVAAVSLYIQQLREKGGGLPEFCDMDGLLYQFFWSRFTREEQELILITSVFDCIREDQLYLIAPGHETELYNVLSRVPMIHRDSRTRSGYPHEILRGFLLRRLEQMPQDFRSRVYQTAGGIYSRMGDRKKAVEFFFQAGDYESLLSCDLTGLLSETFGKLTYTELAGTVLDRSPREALYRHPLSMLRLCLALFAGTDFDGYEKALEDSRAVIMDSDNDQLKGEWHMTAAFQAFPDIQGMKEHYLEAAELMEHPSVIFTKKEPFMFGTTSMWYLFYRTPGRMMETAEDLRGMMQVYDSITDHHGAGAYELYLSEALSVQGRFDESDIAAHKAAVQAEKYENATVTYGVSLVLGINAIYQSDMISLQNAIDYLENHALAYPFLQHTALNRQMAETVRTYLLGLMMEPDRSAVWARGAADILGDLTFTNFMAKTNRITDLILGKEYKRAIASVEASLELDSRLISLSTRNFMCVGLSLCYLAIGAIPRAAEWLDRSLTMAEKDRNYTFLACFRKYLSVLFLLPAIRLKHDRAIREIKALDIHYTKAEESRIFYMLEKNPHEMQELTEREQEVAMLAAEGLRNREIAEKLFISQETVKTHMRSIFQKTNIDRRSKLVELLK